LARKKIPNELKADILFNSDHTCNICRNNENHVQIHHIDEDSQNNIDDNLIVLCLNCHSKVTSNSGLGQSYSELELKKYKNDWEKLISEKKSTGTSSNFKGNCVLKPYTHKSDTGIDVNFGDFIKGEIDLSSPFYIDTNQNIIWMKDFIYRYKNSGCWKDQKRYISPSGMKSYDDKGNLIHFNYPDVVIKTWGAICLQVNQKKYRIECLSFRNSIINSPPDNEAKPLLMEESGRIFIIVNPHPYLEATYGEIRVKIEKSK
jgi:hypothetical protein